MPAAGSEIPGERDAPEAPGAAQAPDATGTREVPDAPPGDTSGGLLEIPPGETARGLFEIPPRAPSGETARGLFEIPPGARRAPTRIVLLTGPSGSGKTSLTGRLGLPVVALDDFYRDGDQPGLPRRHGIVDWDDPRSWDGEGALSALLDIARTGHAEIPLYDIPTNRRTATTAFDAGGSPIVLAEGIFAAELIDGAREEDILADAMCLWRPRLQTFWFRLLRDLGEARKPPLTLLRRGLSLARTEPRMIAELERRGARKVTVDQAEAQIRELLLQRH